MNEMFSSYQFNWKCLIHQNSFCLLLILQILSLSTVACCVAGRKSGGNRIECAAVKKRGRRRRRRSRRTRPDTRPIPVADGWAGAEMRVFTLFDSCSRTNGRTDKGSYRVACPQLKILIKNIFCIIIDFDKRRGVYNWAAFDFLPRDALRCVKKSMILFPTNQ